MHTDPAIKDFDFSTFVQNIPLTRKQRLIEECIRENVSIYINDQSEMSVGVYAIFNPVASESELQIRLDTKNKLSYSKRLFIINCALIFISIIDLCVKLYSILCS